MNSTDREPVSITKTEQAFTLQTITGAEVKMKEITTRTLGFIPLPSGLGMFVDHESIEVIRDE